MISRTNCLKSSGSLLLAMMQLIILFSSASQLFWPRPRYSQRPTDQAASRPLPSMSESTAHVNLPTKLRLQGGPVLMRCFPHQPVFGTRIVYRWLAISTKTAASILEEPQWDNKRRKPVEASPEICAWLPRLVRRSLLATPLPLIPDLRRRQC